MEPQLELAKISQKLQLKFDIRKALHRTTKLSECRGAAYVDEFTLFTLLYDAIPNLIHEINIDCKKANRWFLKTYASSIQECHYNRRYFDDKKAAALDDIIYILFDDLILSFSTNSSHVRFFFKKTSPVLVEELVNGIIKFRERQSRRVPEISLLMQTPKGIRTTSLEISKPKLSIEDNYNDDFLEIHQTILRRLQKKNDKGLVLLHGKPGTGKTSYIRYLIASVKKDVIFLPPHLANALTNPDLMEVMVDNPNSIFVIGDAENIIIDREKDGRSSVSALLNISDGLLSDCLNIQIICSFNTDISKVDNALLRKGRLIAKYEFKELEVQKANALSQKLGYETNFSSPIPLTAIYNQEEKEFQQIKYSKPIGFTS